MSKIYIVDIEAVDTRYTKQWKEYLPSQIEAFTNKEVVVISGGETPQATTPGAFLNFGGTNVYKSNQLMQIGELFCNGSVKDGDYFLYTDAWNPTVLQLRYMAELLGVNIRIGGMWHAGSYDPHDFLGRLIGDKPWVRYTEAAMFECYNHNFFATDFHINMFCEAFKTTPNNKFKLVGWPMEYLKDSLDGYIAKRKKNKILFPHRIAPEKQPEIFRDLADSMPEYEFVMCQEKELSKEEYHNLLGEAKLVFSANLQETLGISWYEGALVDTIPMVPDRLSYSEMALDDFKYPSEWTENGDSYLEHKEEIMSRIKKYMKDYKKFLPALENQREKLNDDFFNGNGLYMVVDTHL